MDIEIQDLGKKFHKHWIFRDINHSFSAGESVAITGPNGSGKSTLLQILSGFIPASRGTVTYLTKNKDTIDPEEYFRYISYASPFMELIEEFTLVEMLNFHFNFKKKVIAERNEEIAEKMYLQSSKNKPIKFFSSGMKQRLKLGLAFYSNTPVLLLDEPTTNLDEKGIMWYKEEIDKLDQNRTIVVSSNVKNEYVFCKKVLNLEDYS